METIWSFPVSIWSKNGWVKDREQIYLNAFDNDWKAVEHKLPKSQREDDNLKNKIKNIIRPKQKYLCWLYRHYASFINLKNIFCIPENIIFEMFEKLNFQDDLFKTEYVPIVFRDAVTSDNT